MILSLLLIWATQALAEPRFEPDLDCQIYESLAETLARPSYLQGAQVGMSKQVGKFGCLRVTSGQCACRTLGEINSEELFTALQNLTQPEIPQSGPYRFIKKAAWLECTMSGDASKKIPPFYNCVDTRKPSMVAANLFSRVLIYLPKVPRHLPGTFCYVSSTYCRMESRVAEMPKTCQCSVLGQIEEGIPDWQIDDMVSEGAK